MRGPHGAGAVRRSAPPWLGCGCVKALQHAHSTLMDCAAASGPARLRMPPGVQPASMTHPVQTLALLFLDSTRPPHLAAIWLVEVLRGRREDGCVLGLAVICKRTLAHSFAGCMRKGRVAGIHSLCASSLAGDITNNDAWERCEAPPRSFAQRRPNCPRPPACTQGGGDLFVEEILANLCVV